MEYVLRLTGEQHMMLYKHLFPGDGKEAAALVVCGRRNGEYRHVLIAKKVVPIPYDICEERSIERVVWPTRIVDSLLPMASKAHCSIMKIHSHPTGYDKFSEFDDKADLSFLGSIHHNLEDDLPHGSAVMLPEGRVFGRVMDKDRSFHPIRLVSVAGDDIFLWNTDNDFTLPEFVRRQAQAFGEGTTRLLQRLNVAVVGCSGTGSPLIEQLVRLGVGRLVIVDPDKVEEKNLNRISFTTIDDAKRERLKVEVIKEAIELIGLGTKVEPFAKYLESPDAVKAIAECDFIFGCMDSMSGRDLLNRLATYYSIPYIDLGVGLWAKEKGGIDKVVGAVHYLQPGRSSLRSRNVYDSEDVKAELMKRNNPEEYRKQLKEKYIRGVQEDQPAVISINTQVAAMAVNEMLARIHIFRYEQNSEFSVQWLALHEGHIFRKKEEDFPRCYILGKEIGRGDAIPLLNRPDLSE